MNLKQVKKLRLSPPWVVYQKQVKALFENDPDVSIETAQGAEGPEITLYVAKPLKAAALARILPECKDFCNVKCRINIVPGNGAGGGHGATAMPKAPEDAAELAMAAFGENGAVAEIRHVSKGLFRGIAYVAFKRAVVQFPADNLGDINGNWNGLYETVAREVCERAYGICFCTTGSTNLALGVWP